MSEIRTVRALVRGRVQGVGFRAWTAEEAGRRGLGGSVRNRADGTVEAVLSGAPEAVAAMLAALRHGPASARVDDVTVAPVDAPADPPFRMLRS